MFTLEEGLIATQEALELLLKNDYPAALEAFREYAHDSLCHSHCYSLTMWLKAYLSLELVSC